MSVERCLMFTSWRWGRMLSVHFGSESINLVNVFFVVQWQTCWKFKLKNLCYLLNLLHWFLYATKCWQNFCLPSFATKRVLKLFLRVIWQSLEHGKHDVKWNYPTGTLPVRERKVLWNKFFPRVLVECWVLKTHASATIAQSCKSCFNSLCEKKKLIHVIWRVGWLYMYAQRHLNPCFHT